MRVVRISKKSLTHRMKTKLHDSKSHAQYSVSSFFFILVIIVMEKQAFEIMEK